LSLLQPRPPGDRASAVILLVLVAAVLAGSTVLLATAGDPVLERKAPILLVTPDGVEAGVAVVLREEGGEAVVRVPGGLSGKSGLLVLVDASQGEARVYVAGWRGAPLGLPWLARLALAGQAELPGGGGEACGYAVESLAYDSRSVRLVAAQAEAGEGLDAVMAVLYRGEAALWGTGVVTVNGSPVPLEPGGGAPPSLLSLPLPGELRGASGAPTSIVVEARLVAGEAVVGGGDCRLVIGVALLQPLKVERLQGLPEPGEAAAPLGVDSCEPKLVRQEDLGKPLTYTYSDPVEPYAFTVNLGGEARTALLNLAFQNVNIEVTLRPVKTGQFMVCTLTDPAGNPLPLARAFQVGEAPPP